MSADNRHGIARKMIVAVILFSSLITLVITAYQLYRDYNLDLSTIDLRLQEIQDVHLKNITNSLWVADNAEMKTILEGVHHLPHMQYLEIREEDKVWAAVGQFSPKNTIVREYPLIYDNMGEALTIGKLTAVASLEQVYRQLIDRGVVILVSNAFKTFLVAGFMLILFHFFISRHLVDIAEYLHLQDIDEEYSPLRLQRNKAVSARGDELDLVVDKINLAQQNLQNSYTALRESEEKYRLAMDATEDGLWDFDVANDQVYYSTGWKRILREDSVEANYLEWEKRIHPDDRERILASLKSHMAGETSYWQEEHRLQRGDGSWVWVIGRGKVVARDTDGNPLRMVGTMTDISDRVVAREELRASEKQFRELVNNIPDILYRTDVDGRITWISPSVEKIAGFTQQEAIGLKLADEVYANPGDRSVLLHELQQKGFVENFEAQLKHKNGSIWWGSANVHLLTGENGELLGVEGIVRDITERKNAEQQLSYQATHDTLTGLINRHELERRTKRLLVSLPDDGDEHALCFMDLDQFKVINDTCGHIAGDELLRQLGMLLSQTVRKRDTLARLGGDEFAVLMEHCTLNQARRVADSLLNSLLNYQFTWEGQSFRIGASIGLAVIARDTVSFTELMKQADSACYMAKDLGRNRIHVYHPEDSDLAQRKGEMQWITRINQALEEDRLCLFAQSIMNLDTGDPHHYEILIRMRDRHQKIIPPGAFLPAAERYNLIEILDRWVVKQVFSLLTEHPRFVEQIGLLSINLSGPSLTNDSFLEFVIGQLDQSGLDASRFCFEITETVAISNLTTAIGFISALKAKGCRFALDDFGSGLSSFGYLKNLPVDYLKIDGIFVKDIVDDNMDYAMVKSINEIAHVMGMQTIAEFVENDEIKGMLKAIGVNYVQGYGIGRPVPIETLVQEVTDKTVCSA